MKISRAWLQTYFEDPLPDVAALSDALTFHAFEIESIENDILDVKVTPNRGHDCLSHRGIAKELSAILNVPMKSDPLRAPVSLEPKSDAVSVSIQGADLCKRYIAGYIRGVKVGPSPLWLQKSLEAVGQRSVNNVVDATNFVMFDLGQPLHAFDAGKLAEKDGKYSIEVAAAGDGEKMVALDGKEYVLTNAMLTIRDANAGSAIGIAGVKGGMPASITEETKDIIIESANFDGVSTRKTAQALKLRTDASARFEQVISPELAAYGMRAVTGLIVQLAGGEVVGFSDESPKPEERQSASVSVSKINAILGTELTGADVADAFVRLGLAYKEEGGTFDVVVPFERLDIRIPEDLVEEVGRIIGYDKVVAKELPSLSNTPEVNANFFAAEHTREELVSKGYSEVFTSVFAGKGERIVLNKVDGVNSFLRDSLVSGLQEASEKNKHNKDLLQLKEIKLFEIGTVWRDGKERVMLGTVSEHEAAKEVPLEVFAEESPAHYEDLPLSATTRYQTFSKYPFIVRDIALWTPAGTRAEDVLEIIRGAAGELLVRSSLFDSFEKGDKISYAFRLVFQSFDRTLTDGDANERMESVNAAVAKKGWQVR